MGVPQSFLSPSPIETRVGNGYAVSQIRLPQLRQILSAEIDVALHHETDDGAIAFDDLIHAVLKDQRLERGVLQRISVARIDDDVDGKLRFLKRLLDDRDMD